MKFSQDYPPPLKVLEQGMDRFIADGAHYRDLVKLKGKITDWDSWPMEWAAVARVAEARGEQNLAQGRKLTAAQDFAQSSLYFHLSQYLLYDDLKLKKELHDHKNRVFMRGASLLLAPVERVTFPFRGIEIAGYLRRPAGISNPPVVICLGGADTTKEDYLNVSNLCLERGMATFAFDGPGQGETYFQMLLIPDWEECVVAAIDFLQRRPEIDSSRIGIIGRSLGGYLAPKAASIEPRIKALACWGVKYDAKDLPTRGGIAAASMFAMAGVKTLEEAVDFYKFLDLEGHVGRIQCPVFVTHGGLDAMPVEGARRFISELPTKAEVLIWDDSGHCCHDRSHIMRPAMVDFLMQAL